MCSRNAYRALKMIFWVAFVCHRAAAAEHSDREAIEHFEQHVRPILVTHCLKCHSGDEPKGQLRLDSEQSMLQGGESGPAIVANDPDSSLMISALRYESFEMPPDHPLEESEIRQLEHWIRDGAMWPTDTTLSVAMQSGWEITEADRQHWSFRPIVDPPVAMTVSSDTWSRNPIDRFIYRQLHNNGLTPAPAADRRTLARRVYFDLLGLPPTPDQVDRFEHDPSATAFEDLVDRLLAHPAYGERWARHWLDLVRYGESDGYRQDAYRPNAWRYRDYVIASFNTDKPYDQFIREQLAGDELYPDNPSAWIGTAFLRLHLYEYNQRDVITQRQDILNDITDVTADVFLGLGMKCARCHDHKFDPVSQLDYFRLQAHFAALIPRDKVPLVSRAELQSWQQRQDAWLAATKSIRDEIADIRRPYEQKRAQATLVKFTPDIKRIFDISPEDRSPLERQIMYFVDRQAREEGSAKPSDQDAERIKQLEKRLAEFSHLKPAALPRTDSVTDTGCVAPVTRIPNHDAVVEPGGVEIVCHLVPTVTPFPPSSQSTGRRTALARWLTSPTNPLTARVVVNRIWHHHFGRGLVDTPSDFGTLGNEPSHPELLDWLATRFVEDGWSWKSIHRLMITSATYRQSATHPQANAMEAIDPANQLRWRWDVRRLDAEQVVDALLCAAGQIDLSVGGPSSDGKAHRRGIYRKMHRNKPDKLLALFDLPDGINSVASRPVTTTPTQALALLNGKLGTTTAASMAERLITSCGDDRTAVVKKAYRLAFSRPPSEDEIGFALDYLGDDALDETLLSEFCHVLLNANEFVYLD